MGWRRKPKAARDARRGDGAAGRERGLELQGSTRGGEEVLPPKRIGWRLTEQGAAALGVELAGAGEGGDVQLPVG